MIIITILVLQILVIYDLYLITHSFVEFFLRKLFLYRSEHINISERSSSVHLCFVANGGIFCYVPVSLETACFLKPPMQGWCIDEKLKGQTKGRKMSICKAITANKISRISSISVSLRSLPKSNHCTFGERKIT